MVRSRNLHMTRRTSFISGILLLGGCGDDGTTSASASSGQITSASASASVSASAATEDTGGLSQSGSTEGASEGVSDGTTVGASGQPTSTGGPAETGPLLDIGVNETGFETTDTSSADGCVAVDLLFVIDNSVSMGDYQNALALAFPAFADAIVETLPPGTNLHIGVTSTTMAPSNSGSTSNCVATGDNDQPQDFFYQTSDMGDNGINGAQGRLYEPAGGPYYYSIDTDAGPAELEGLKSWFAKAAKIGEGGSQVEMSAAAAGWVADPANAATNAGFVRDAGAVLALFFLQDEADQTPWTIDGQPGGLAMLDKLSAAKSVCGGAECIIGGGFANLGCLDQVPLGDLVGNLGAPAVMQELPDEDLAEDFPEMAAEEMNQLLRDTLAAVIAQKCDEISPPE